MPWSTAHISVSYTHLDVYKRQVLLVAVLAWSAWAGALGQGILWGVVQLGPWQLHPLALLFALSGSLMISKTCLLYTSRCV